MSSPPLWRGRLHRLENCRAANGRIADHELEGRIRLICGTDMWHIATYDGDFSK